MEVILDYYQVNIFPKVGYNKVSRGLRVTLHSYSGETYFCFQNSKIQYNVFLLFLRRFLLRLMQSRLFQFRTNFLNYEVSRHLVGFLGRGIGLSPLPTQHNTDTERKDIHSYSDWDSDTESQCPSYRR
jgi:hypothetical protein